IRARIFLGWLPLFPTPNRSGLVLLRHPTRMTEGPQRRPRRNCGHMPLFGPSENTGHGSRTTSHVLPTFSALLRTQPGSSLPRAHPMLSVSRSTFMKRLFAFAALFLLTVVAKPIAAHADDLFDIKPMADGVYAAIAKPAYKVNCNAAIIFLGDSV